MEEKFRYEKTDFMREIKEDPHLLQYGMLLHSHKPLLRHFDPDSVLLQGPKALAKVKQENRLQMDFIKAILQRGDDGGGDQQGLAPKFSSLNPPPGSRRSLSMKSDGALAMPPGVPSSGETNTTTVQPDPKPAGPKRNDSTGGS